jgi:cytochrome c-type biogenesis protein CcmH
VSWFIAIAAAMIAGALAWVLPPLLRRRELKQGPARRQTNLAVLRDQQAELDADLERGIITRGHYERARSELERRVLEETAEPAPGNTGQPDGRWVAGIVGAVIPLAAAVLYYQIGNPEAMTQAGAQHGAPEVTAAQVQQIVGRLAARLQEKPDDPEGWYLLGRSYYVMGRFSDSAAAFEKAVKLKVEDAALYADYADALAMSQDRRVDDKVLALVEHALELDPDHPKALIIAGTAALQRKDYRGAVGYLERLERVAPPGSELAGMVAERLQEARAEVGAQGDPKGDAKGNAKGDVKGNAKGDARTQPGLKGAAMPDGQAVAGAKSDGTAAPRPEATIKGRVTLSPSLAAKAAPTDTVFILARALEGPRMPLAILKRQVRDLPLEFTLSDAESMSPEMKLSKFREVIVVARVSKSGGAAPQSGDLQGSTSAVKVGSTQVTLQIDSVVP